MCDLRCVRRPLQVIQMNDEELYDVLMLSICSS